MGRKILNGVLSIGGSRRHSQRHVMFGAGGVLTAALCVLAGAAAGAFASGGSPNVGQAPTPNSGIAAPSAAQVASFPVLGQAATTGEASTSPQALHMLESSETQYHVNPALGRDVVNNAVATAVMVPGEGAVCFLVLGNVGPSSSLCGPEAGAAKEGLSVVESLPSGGYVIVGVRPASEAASTVVVTNEAGEETSFKLSAQNGYAFETNGKPVAMHWISGNGTTATQSTLLPKE